MGPPAAALPAPALGGSGYGEALLPGRGSAAGGGAGAARVLWAALAGVALGSCALATVAAGRWPPTQAPGASAAGLQLDAVSHWQPVLSSAFLTEPVAKNTVRRFDAYLMQQAAFDDPETKLRNVEQWLAPDFVYETVGFPSSSTPAGWCVSGEEKLFRRAFNVSVFSQMLFFGTDTFATTTSYGNVLWAEDLFGVPAPRAWTYFRVTDFYSARRTSATRGQLYYNFMMMDFADMFRRAGRPVLPPAELPEGFVMTSAANDGVPAPLSVVARLQDAQAAQQASDAAIEEDWVANGPGGGSWHSNLTFYGPGGIGVARGVEQYRRHVLGPFKAAFSQRQLVKRISGCEGNYCGTFGELKGLHVGTWLGLQASHRSVAIRYAFHWHVINGLVQEGWAIFDVPGLFSQLGLDFFALAARGGRES